MVLWIYSKLNTKELYSLAKKQANKQNNKLIKNEKGIKNVKTPGNKTFTRCSAIQDICQCIHLKSIQQNAN